jgi:1-deoxy-D-xylulose-5-phosphate reductoisomerase
VVAVAGASAGLDAALAALGAGKDVALATKEVLVCAGELVMRTAAAAGRRILPIDSEHSAIFQCLQGNRQEDIERLWLTASGGPFRDWSLERMAAATPADALQHPTWPSMGRKITVDSATLMNKALEIIEGRWLFDIPADKIGVIVHAQSVVHSLVEFCDGSVMAQLGRPDMRLPIQYALLYPERIAAGLPALDLLHGAAQLTFEDPDEARFPSIRIARQAAERGGTAPAAMSAANDEAVSLFLQQKISFPEITGLVEAVLNKQDFSPAADRESIRRADSWARNLVGALAG